MKKTIERKDWNYYNIQILLIILTLYKINKTSILIKNIFYTHKNDYRKYSLISYIFLKIDLKKKQKDMNKNLGKDKRILTWERCAPKITHKSILMFLL